MTGPVLFWTIDLVWSKEMLRMRYGPETRWVDVNCNFDTRLGIAEGGGRDDAETEDADATDEEVVMPKVI